MLEGYDVIESVHGGQAFWVQRLRRREDGALVMAKGLLPDATGAEAATLRLRHCHRMLMQAHALQVPNISQPLLLVDQPNQRVLVTHDIGGASLQALQAARALTVMDILHVASEVVAALVVLHANDIVHRGIGQHTIVYNPNSKRVNLINFSAAQALSSTPMGHRADIRALGKTLAQLLQGNLVAHLPASARRAVASMVHTPAKGNTPTAFHLAAELRRAMMEAHAIALRLQRETTEIQMAGGFAHEMRNALAGALYMTEDVFSSGGLLGNIESHITQAQNIADALSHEQPSLNACVAALERGHNIIADAADVFGKSLARAKNIISSILGYAEVRYVASANHEVAIADVLDDVIAAITADLAKARITVVRERWDACNVQLGRDHAHTILTSIVRNAYDALKDVDRARQLILRIQRVHSRVRIDVQDTGSGIAPAVKRLVFQPFFSTKGIHGRGLNLALAHKLAEASGGTIAFSSQLGVGTTFHIELPICLD